MFTLRAGALLACLFVAACGGEDLPATETTGAPLPPLILPPSLCVVGDKPCLDAKGTVLGTIGGTTCSCPGGTAECSPGRCYRAKSGNMVFVNASCGCIY